MVFNLAPVPNLGIYISYLQSFLHIFRLLFKDTLKKIECLIGLSNNEKNIAQVIETSDVIGVFLKYLLIYGFGGKVLLHPIKTNSHILKNIKILTIN